MDEEIQSLGTAEEVRHAVVDVEGLVNSMKERLDSISESTTPPFHICRVPATIRNKDNHVYYNPKIVSIGPFHRQSKNLQAMEEHKWRYLHNVLRHCTLQECVNELMKIEGEARKCYSGNINMGLKPYDEFVKMMLLDGSFIIQLLLFRNEIEQNDPICRTIWMVPAIAMDLLLLENQLPFCVLKCLAKCVGCDAVPLKEEALKFFFKSLPAALNFKKDPDTKTLVLPEVIHHLLHLVHCSLELAPPTTKKPFSSQPLQVVRKILSFQSLRCLANNNRGYEPLPEVQETGAPSCNVPTQEQLITIPTATKLKEAGVVFERNEGGSFLDVTFKKRGVMRLPRLQITDDTNSLFRNMIAFEQCFRDSGLDFTNYCIFMDSLVNTPRDVQILKQSHIIEHQLGSDEEVTLLFNQLCKEISGNFRQGSLGNVCDEINQYAETPWHEWRATLKHKYFSNPWALISFIAAGYVLILTSVQAFYSLF